MSMMRRFGPGRALSGLRRFMACAKDGARMLVAGFMVLVALAAPSGAYASLAAPGPEPIVTRVSPGTGPIGGGTTVVITGAGFTGALGVKFGGTHALNYNVNDSTQITATAPSGSVGTVDVTVTTSGGTSATSSADQFTYVAAPVASSFRAPAMDYNVSGDSFSLSGHVTNSPTSYAVGSATTAQGGSVSVSASGQVIYSAPPFFYGDDSFTYTATNAAGTSNAATVTVPINVPDLRFSVRKDAGWMGAPFSGIKINVTGGLAPYSCDTVLAGGALPEGTQLNSDCTITGTPTEIGDFSFYPQVSDSSRTTGPVNKARSTLILTVSPVANLTLASGAPSGAQVGGSYRQINTAGGGIGPYRYALNTGDLVPGTQLDPSTGLVSGTPTHAGSFSYSLRVTDSQTPAVTTQSESILVTVAKGDQTVSFITNAPSGVVGGDAPYAVSAVASSGLPTAISIDASSASICTTSGGAVTFRAAGVCIINANQAGGANWNAAPQAQQSITVSAPAALTSSIDFTPSSLNVGATGTVTLTFTNTNASDSPSFSALLTSPIQVSRIPGAPGGSCVVGANTVPMPNTVHLANIIVPPGSCTVTLNYNGATAGAASGFTLGAFSPSGYPTTPATVGNGFSVVPVVSAISPNSGPGHQVVTISGSGFSTTPGDNTVLFGAAGPGVVTAASPTSLTVQAPAVGSGTAVVTVAVNGQTSTTSSVFTFLNAPVAANKSGVAIPFNGSGTAIDLSASITGAHTSISIGAAPAHGVVSISGDVVTYKPNADYYGADSFTYTATGQGGTSNVATVSVVVATPGAPVAADKTGVAVSYNSTGAAIDLSGSITGVHSSIAISAAPAHGVVSVAGDVAIYIPTADYYGADSFTYTATGPGGVSSPATVSVVVATPAAPVVTSPTDPIVVPSSQGGGVVAVDLGPVSQGVIEGFRITAPGLHGVAELVEGGQAGLASVARAATPSAAGGVQLTYRPVANFMGTDAVTLVAYGPGGDSAPVTFTFQVGGKAPDMTAAIASDAVVRLSPTEGLVGGPFKAVRITRAPAFGTATVDGLDIVFTPGAANGGSTLLDYVVDLAFGPSAAGRVDLTSNLVPSVQALTATTLQGAPVTVRISDTAGGPFTGAAIVSINPTNAGTAEVVKTGANWDLTFTPADAFSGQAVATFSLSNAAGTSNGTLTITVEPRPDPSKDVEVRGVATAQVTSARRFADAQLNNFQRRLQSLHDGTNASSNGLSLNFGGPSDLDKDPRTALRRALGGHDPIDPGALNDRSRDMLGLDLWAGRDAGAQASGRGAQTDRLGAASAKSGGREGGGSRLGFWTAGSLDWGRQDADGQRDYRFSTQGVTVGLDVKAGERLIIGAGLGYGEDETKIGDNGSVSSGSAVTGALYASWRLSEAFYVDGVAGYANLDFDARRWTTGLAGQPDGYAASERSGEARFVSAAFGRLLRGGSMTTDIYARVDAREISLDGFTETGVGHAALVWDGVEQRSVSANFGAAWRWAIETRRHGQIAPSARLEWSRELEDIGAQGVRYADWAASPTYLVPLDAWSRNAINVDLGAEWSLTDRLMLGLGYRGALGDASTSHGAEIRFKYGW